MLRLLDLLDIRSWAGNIAHTALGITGAAALGLTFQGEIAASFGGSAASAAVPGEETQELALASYDDLNEMGLIKASLADEGALERSIRDSAAQLEKERRCLATSLYFEARGESYAGQLAVAEVVLNRVASKLYPNSICEVVYQGSTRVTGCQFSFTCDSAVSVKPRDRGAWAKAARTASHVLMGKVREPVIGEGVTHYHADYVTPFWADTRYKVTKIGRHIFYRNPDPAARS